MNFFFLLKIEEFVCFSCLRILQILMRYELYKSIVHLSTQLSLCAIELPCHVWDIDSPLSSVYRKKVRFFSKNESMLLSYFPVQKHMVLYRYVSWRAKVLLHACNELNLHPKIDFGCFLNSLASMTIKYPSFEQEFLEKQKQKQNCCCSEIFAQ